MSEALIDITNHKPAARETLLSAQGLCFDARGQRLIDSVNLEVATGRCTVIMGANGSGKSLLLRLLHGLITPSAGTINWRGGSLDHVARLQQAMVFQRPVMLRRSVAANLRFALKVRGVHGAERKTREAEALALAKLENLKDKPARVLSGGEQQRLAMARALISTPALLFLDEPTASLDPASSLAIERLIETARENGTTIVLVTHDAGQARRLGDDLLFLHNGQIAEAGPVTRILEAPQSEAAQAWLGGRIFVPDNPKSETI
ncbi:tungstate transport system ATP-binding protein [Sulfitobacter undariae]|uniref:Tungstate transport system ATP-binding protein n=1 Tax=Sulfitobacter undariae TaxID=1563671 RepID=A0A7W6E528_9RHOB|nr:ATP-binding cassette domain-containing protein [Sulfitobacter undariae]MBB3994898.1 tungstate transport system ATP-binding protein [Sulfitobacter undariae]